MKPALEGRTIQIDPTFAYYQNRSAESIADELLQNGFRSVHYFVVNENNVNRELVEALQWRGLKVWAVTITRPVHNTVVISFQKRIDEASAKQPGNLRIVTGIGTAPVDPADIHVDGNQLVIRSDQLPRKGFKLRIKNITDTPQLWLYNKTQPAKAVTPGTIVNVSIW